MSKKLMYYRFLKEEGYLPRFDEDGDIVFKADGITYLLFASESDVQYFRLALPAFWEIEDILEYHRMLNAAATVNADVKVVKIYPVENRVWASVEMLFDPPENFKPVFRRALRLLRHGVERFAALMKAPVQ